MRAIIVFVIIACASLARAEVMLPAVFSDRMILRSDPAVGKSSMEIQIKLRGFAVAGEDQRSGSATVDGARDKLIVSNPSVAAPVAVRCSGVANSLGNSINAADLAASPIRTDDWN